MRRLLSFICEGSRLFATLDEAAGSTGLLIVSGGNEIRIGAHRGMAQLAADMAKEGHPVLRFDRRGIGDSEGENGGFEESALDLAAAVSAFRAACPQLNRIVGFGNCDAASALVLHQPQHVAALVLANIWTIEGASDLPPPAAIKARYLERIRDPRAWLRLLGGGVNVKKLAAGMLRLARPAPSVAPTSLPQRVAEGLARFPGPVSILLAKGDATAIAFMDWWRKPLFEAATARTDLQLVELDSSSHSFASEADYAALSATLLNALRG